ncbi:MAG: DUF1080 domain-containing protein [Verrucomicrobia bacterium]|nr:DUF1080 domain-containing protein [Verrucomicrobiota bacterium]
MLFVQNAPAATTIHFDNAASGSLPAGWIAGVTGKGAPKWSIEKEDSAPSKPGVLKQSGEGTYPWCVKNDVSLKDGYVEVKFKPLSGETDQAGGVVWRWKDADNYYIARANALEDNVRIYHFKNGKRTQFKTADLKVPANQWHTLRVEFEGSRFKVIFNGKPLYEAEDATFAEAGAVGVWTKADSVTLFDDFSFGTE